MPGRSPLPEVYVWASGQDDNIGDTLLRRPYLRSLESGPRAVYVRDATSDFIDGLALREQDLVTATLRTWLSSALRSAVSRPTVIALNAGEVRVSRRGAAKLALMTLAGLVARVRGGALVWAGASVPNRHPLWSRVYRAAARSTNVLRWRDALSSETVTRGPVGPDWAFAEGTQTSAWPTRLERTRVGLVLRGDRDDPDEAWLEWFREFADALKLQPVMVVQVRRDNARAEQLAQRFGWPIVGWPQELSHLEQEDVVRQAYAECAVVVGDRLHGLVAAATEGALPLGWVPSSRGKVGRHFEVVGLDFVGEFEGSAPADLPRHVPEVVDTWPDDLRSAVEAARSELSTLELRIGERLPGR